MNAFDQHRFSRRRLFELTGTMSGAALLATPLAVSAPSVNTSQSRKRCFHRIVPVTCAVCKRTTGKGQKP